MIPATIWSPKMLLSARKCGAHLFRHLCTWMQSLNLWYPSYTAIELWSAFYSQYQTSSSVDDCMNLKETALFWCPMILYPLKNICGGVSLSLG